MQSIYAMSQSQSQNLDKELRFLQRSADDMYNLYLLTLALFKELHKMASEQIEIAQKKYLATAKERNPNKKLIENEVLRLISQNELLEETIANAGMNRWDLDSEYVKIIYKKIIEHTKYEEYMSDKKRSFKQDKDFLIFIFQFRT